MIQFLSSLEQKVLDERLTISCIHSQQVFTMITRPCLSLKYGNYVNLSRFKCFYCKYILTAQYIFSGHGEEYDLEGVKVV